MTFDFGVHNAMKNEKLAKLHTNFVVLKVLPALDEDGVKDYLTANREVGDERDLPIVREAIKNGVIRASGVYVRNDERVGSLFYTVIPDDSGDKTLLVIGIGAHRNDADAHIYEGIVDAAQVLAKQEGCRWLRAGSTRLGAIRQLLAKGATPVRVEFCMEVK